LRAEPAATGALRSARRAGLQAWPLLRVLTRYCPDHIFILH
jgi:hypothetical protein